MSFEMRVIMTKGLRSFFISRLQMNIHLELENKFV
jgi:hypothetical protein